MDPKKLMDALHTSGRLKDTTRHCYTPGGRHESVAEHSWRAALMAYLMKDEFPEADMDKVVRMLLIHDLGECFTGDIPTFAKTEEHEKTEEKLLNAWLSTLPEPFSSEMAMLYREMEERKTLEAKIYKCIDGLEAVISHNESDISTWEDHEYQLNRSYAEDRVQFSDYLVALRRAIREETEEKIAREGGI